MTLTQIYKPSAHIWIMFEQTFRCAVNIRSSWFGWRTTKHAESRVKRPVILTIGAAFLLAASTSWELLHKLPQTMVQCKQTSTGKALFIHFYCRSVMTLNGSTSLHNQAKDATNSSLTAASSIATEPFRCLSIQSLTVAIPKISLNVLSGIPMVSKNASIRVSTFHSAHLQRLLRPTEHFKIK